MLQQQIKQILKAENLTVYGLCQIIGAETDEPLNSLNVRWNRLLKKTPKTLADLERDLDAIGYRLQVVKKP